MNICNMLLQVCKPSAKRLNDGISDENREDGLVNCSTSDGTFGENNGNGEILNVCYTFKINLFFK